MPQNLTKSVSECKEYWEIPYHSEHLWQAEIHGLPNGNCKYCGKPYVVYEKQVHEFLKSKPTPTNPPTENNKATIYHDHELFGDNREKAILRDGEKCVKCGMTREEHKKKYNKDLAVDHINGLGKGVSRDKKDNRLENLQTFCWKCHAIKEAANKDLKAMAKLGGLAVKNKYGKAYYQKMAIHMNKVKMRRKNEK